MNYDTKSRRMLLALFQETGDAALSTEEITEKMKDSNKLFSSEPREGLISAGYKPCGNCKP